MPYSRVSDLPENVKHVLPEHAQAIYKDAFNNAYNEYRNPKDRREGTDREDVARRVAWSAVKKKYEKGDDGSWHLKK